MDVIAAPVPAYSESSPRRFMQLPPIQTSFTVIPTRRVRPLNPTKTTLDSALLELINDNVETSELTHRTSKGGLLALFRRKKVAKSSEIHEPEKMVEEAKAAHRPMSRDTERPHNNAALHCDPRNVTPATRSRTLRRRSSKPGPRSISLKRELRIKTVTTWDPPPLFQAYPQAVTYGSLRAPTISTDALLGSKGDKKNRNTKFYAGEIHDSANLKPVEVDTNAARRRYSRRKPKHTMAEPIPKEDWTRNLYVLVTSGYFLQYAGEGSFDRLPEKIMALSKDSAAFASDVILGEHWVLQVSQFSDENGIQSSKESGSIMKKIGLSRDAKRSASRFLLVLDSPEEMDAWLKAVRGEIESMGGRKYRPDAGAPNFMEDAACKEHESLSHRYSIIRSPDQYSGRRYEPAPYANFRNVNSANGGSSSFGHQSPTTTVRRRSIASQMSADSPSNATVSINQSYLDQLRGSPRISYASTGAKTLSTSPGSSPGPSPRPGPAKLTFPLPEDSSELGQRATPIYTLPISRRASAQTSCHLGDPSAEFRSNSRSASRSPRQLSTHRSPSKQNVPPATPNFSVPTFAKRNSLMPRGSSPSTNQASRSPFDDFELSKSLSNRDSLAIALPIDNEDVILSLPYSSSSNELSPLPTKQDRPLPRRLSSLQYSRGIRPKHLAADQLLPPHPPPRSALPAVPVPVSLGIRKSLDCNSSQNRQLRRPLSMQARSDPVRLVHRNLPQSISEDKLDFDCPSQPSSDFSAQPDRCPPPPPVQISIIQNCRSMPEIGLPGDFLPHLPLPDPHHEPRSQTCGSLFEPLHAEG